MTVACGPRPERAAGGHACPQGVQSGRAPPRAPALRELVSQRGDMAWSGAFLTGETRRFSW
jgi:hypothetical protein